jgi:hypothetical protein
VGEGGRIVRGREFRGAGRQEFQGQQEFQGRNSRDSISICLFPLQIWGGGGAHRPGRGGQAGQDPERAGAVREGALDVRRPGSGPIHAEPASGVDDRAAGLISLSDDLLHPDLAQVNDLAGIEAMINRGGRALPPARALRQAQDGLGSAASALPRLASGACVQALGAETAFGP